MLAIDPYPAMHDWDKNSRWSDLTKIMNEMTRRSQKSSSWSTSLMSNITAGQVSEFLIDCKVDFDHLDPPGLLSSLQEWLDQHCEQAFFGLAKTRNVVQGTVAPKNIPPIEKQQSVERKVLHALQFNMLDFPSHCCHTIMLIMPILFAGVIRTRSWSTCTEVKTSLCSTFLRKAHGSTAVYQTSDPSFPTYRDALGLCQLHRLEPGFQELRHKISDADLQEGVNCYLQMGECDSMKGKIVLAPETALSQAVTFHHFMALPANIGLRETLVKMHRSGRYIPDVKLVASIPVDKAESIFKMCISPDTVSLQDIDCVYFDAQPDIPTQKTQPTAATQNRAGSILEGLDLFWESLVENLLKKEVSFMTQESGVQYKTYSSASAWGTKFCSVLTCAYLRPIWHVIGLKEKLLLLLRSHNVGWKGVLLQFLAGNCLQHGWSASWL